MQTINLVCDLGGSRIKFALVAGDEIAAMGHLALPPRQHIRKTLDEVLDAARTLAQGADLAFETIHGVGLAFPGIVDSNACRVLSVNDKHTGVVDFDVKKWVFSNGFKRVAMENDARAALLGEYKHNPSLASTETCVGMTLGTGIGVAAIVNGNLLQGAKHQAAITMGHGIVAFNQGRCNCGGMGCAEHHASTWALRERTPWNSFQELFADIDQGNTSAAETLDTYLDVWASCLVNIAYAYDPEVIVIGGGVMHRHESVLPELRRKMTDRRWNGFVLPELIPSILMERAALLGMNALLGSGPVPGKNTLLI